MSIFSVISQSTGDFMQIADMSFAHETSGTRIGATDLELYIDACGNTEINRVESFLLYNMIQGNTALTLSDNSFGAVMTQLNNDASHNFGNNVLFNNVGVNTPNFAIITSAYPKTGVAASSFELPVGLSAIDISGTVSLNNGSSNPHLNEDVSFNFTANTHDTSNNDAGDNWYVGFSGNNNISKAVNSQLSCLSGSNPFNPIVVTEPLFNTTDALGSDNPFGHYYERAEPSGSNAYVGVPSRADFTSNNDIAGYVFDATSGTSLTYYDERSYGAWDFSQNETTIDVSYSHDVDVLPFGIATSNTGLGHDLSGSLSYPEFGNLFANVNSTQDFSFNVVATSNGGGYYSSEADAAGITLNSSSLVQKFAYTNASLGKVHQLNVVNGTLDVSGLSNAVSSTTNFFIDLDNRPKKNEQLPASLIDVSGYITLDISGVYDRTTFSGTDFSGVAVSYNASDAALIDGSWNTNIGSITSSMKTSSVVDVSAQYLLNGYRLDPSGYDYSNGNSHLVLLDGQEGTESIFYSDNVSYLDVSSVNYSADTTGVNSAAVYMVITGYQNVANVDSELIDLIVDVCGNGPPTGSSAKILDISGVDTEFTPSVILEGVSLNSLLASDPDYDQLRVRYVPKTVAQLELSGFTDDGWSIVTGLVTSETGYMYDASFTEQTDASYVTTSIYNFNLLGIDGINAGSNNDAGLNHGLGLNNLYHGYGDASSSFAFDISYCPAGTKFGADKVVYSIAGGSMDLAGDSLASSSSGSFVGYGVYSDVSYQTASLGGPAYFRAVTQIPIGHYTNVYLKTPWLHTNGNSLGKNEVITTAYAHNSSWVPDSGSISSYDSALTSLVFNRKSVMSLRARIEAGPMDASVNETSEASWSGITEWTNVAAYAGLLTIADLSSIPLSYVEDISGYEYAQVVQSGFNNCFAKITLLEKSTASSYQLSNPQYVAKLDISNSYLDIEGFDLSLNGIQENIVSSFNPSTLGFGGYSGTRVDISYTLNPLSGINLEGDVNLSINYADGSFNIDMSNLIISRSSIWYCPEDVYRVHYRVGSDISNTLCIANDNSNNVLNIKDGADFDGVSLLGTDGTPGKTTSFLLNADSIDYQMVWRTDSANPIPITDLLLADPSGQTETIQLTDYRGYPMATSSANAERQEYEITRTKTTAALMIDSAQYGDPWYLATDISSVTDFGLKFDSSNSIIADGANTDYAIDLSGDPVTITYAINEQIDSSANTKLDVSNGLFNIPGTSNYIVSGRITAGAETEYYSVTKSAQNVTITYSPQYMTDAGNSSPDNWTYDGSSVNVSNVDMSNGYQLTPSVNISLSPTLRSAANTPHTYLNLPPPFLQFQALKNDACSAIPFNYDTTTSSRVSVFMPVTSDDQTQFRPFTDVDVSLNDMSFNRTSGKSLIYYTEAVHGPYSLNVQGSNVVVNEVCNSILTEVYNGPVQDISYNSYSSYEPSNATWQLGYGQTHDSNGPDSEQIIYFDIQDAFMLGIDHILVLTGQYNEIAVYGVEAQNSDGYSVRLHKYVDGAGESYSYDASFSGPSLNGNVNDYTINLINHGLHFGYQYHFIYDLSFAPVDISTNPYTISNIVSQITPTTLSAKNWTFVDESSSSIFFDIVALSLSGETYIKRLFSLSANTIPSVTEGVYARAQYVTLPDLFNAKSADGAAVMRIAYNGTVVTPMVSTTTISLMTQVPTFSHSTRINNEVINYNVTTFDTTI